MTDSIPADHYPHSRTHVLSTEMADDCTPPSASLNPAAMTDSIPVVDRQRVQETACPKCGGGGTSMAYCDSCHGSVRYDRALCSHGDPEHFHHHCVRCGFRWRTDDVIDAKVVCHD